MKKYTTVEVRAMFEAMYSTNKNMLTKLFDKEESHLPMITHGDYAGTLNTELIHCQNNPEEYDGYFEGPWDKICIEGSTGEVKILKYVESRYKSFKLCNIVTADKDKCMLVQSAISYNPPLRYKSELVHFAYTAYLCAFSKLGVLDDR